MIQSNMSDILQYWIRERNRIRNLKELNVPRPWTSDPILRDYKFCNVKREDDAVTKWFAKNWRAEKYWDEKMFIPAIILGRTINWPYTLERIGFPYSYSAATWLEIMDDIQESNRKVYTGAYMITAGPTGIRKNQWVLDNAHSYFRKPPVLDPTSIQKSWEILIANKYPCVGPFIAGQVIADLKQTKHLSGANDWYTWAAIGPGSARGLNRIHGRPVKMPVSQSQGLKELREIRTVLQLEDLCLQDVQNCMCEYDKYVRVMSGEGKPRSGYPGKV